MSNLKSTLHRCQPKNSLREATTRGMGREIEQRDIVRALAGDARYVRARKAFSASWCERPVTARGDRINRKTRRFVRVLPRICRDVHGHRSNLEVQYPRQIHTYIYPHRHNKLPHVQGVVRHCRLYILMRDLGTKEATGRWQLNDGSSNSLRTTRRLGSNAGTKFKETNKNFIFRLILNETHLNRPSILLVEISNAESCKVKMNNESSWMGTFS